MIATGDVVEIEQLLSRYAHLADWLNKGEAEVPGGPTRVTDVFTEDATFRLGESSFTGVDAISQLFAPVPTVHSSSDPYVFEDGDVIRVRSKFAFTNLATGDRMLGDYTDIVVRTSEGWRIHERVARART